MNEIAVLTQRLVASPASDTADLAAKFRAILWLIEVNERLLDPARTGMDLSDCVEPPISEHVSVCVAALREINRVT